MAIKYPSYDIFTSLSKSYLIEIFTDLKNYDAVETLIRSFKNNSYMTKRLFIFLSEYYFEIKDDFKLVKLLSDYYSWTLDNKVFLISIIFCI